MKQAKRSILFVEDEMALAMLVKENLEEQGYSVWHCENGNLALKYYFDLKPDLVLLDVMMPKLNGYEVAKTIRNTDRQTPILFLTAKIKSTDVVKGFESGGNDYIRKPFGMDELLIRIQALLTNERLLRETADDQETNFQLGQMVFDSKQMLLKSSDAVHRNLTSREAELLKLLCIHKNKVVTKTNILLQVWGDDSFFNSRSMDVFISRLRKYLKDEPNVKLVNIRGIGYKLVVD